MGVSGQRHAPAAPLPPVAIVQEAGWAPEPVWTQRIEEKSFAPAGDRSPGRPARSQTLYCLSYLGSYVCVYIYIYMHTYMYRERN
jgi:hypothetical protein